MLQLLLWELYWCSEMNKYCLIYIFSVFIASCSQILLKKSASLNHSSKLKEYINSYVLSAYGVLFISSILTIIAYKGIPLKEGPVIESLGYIFVLFFSYFFFNEKMTKNKISGIFLIIIGIIVFSI